MDACGSYPKARVLPLAAQRRFISSQVVQLLPKQRVGFVSRGESVLPRFLVSG